MSSLPVTIVPVSRFWAMEVTGTDSMDRILTSSVTVTEMKR